jgi:hypothetical protein
VLGIVRFVGRADDAPLARPIGWAALGLLVGAHKNVVCS